MSSAVIGLRWEGSGFVSRIFVELGVVDAMEECQIIGVTIAS